MSASSNGMRRGVSVLIKQDAAGTTVTVAVGDVSDRLVSDVVAGVCGALFTQGCVVACPCSRNHCTHSGPPSPPSRPMGAEPGPTPEA